MDQFKTQLHEMLQLDEDIYWMMPTMIVVNIEEDFESVTMFQWKLIMDEFKDLLFSLGFMQPRSHRLKFQSETLTRHEVEGELALKKLEMVVDEVFYDLFGGDPMYKDDVSRMLDSPPSPLSPVPYPLLSISWVGLTSFRGHLEGQPNLCRGCLVQFLRLWSQLKFLFCLQL